MPYDLYTYFSIQDNALHICLCFMCISIGIASAEYLIIKNQFADAGIFSWRILSSRFFYQKNLQGLNFLFAYRSTVVLLFVRLGCCCVLPFLSHGFAMIACLFVTLIISLLLFYRNVFGNDGSDQMSNILIVTLFLAYVCDDVTTKSICICFIGIQSIVSYMIAGVAKLISAKWRNGTAVIQIMNTKSYGHLSVYSFLKNRNRFFLLLSCWSVVIFECLFFLVAFVPPSLIGIFIVAGIMFHLFIAVVMNLNNFFWSFLATYPCLLYMNSLTHT